MLVDWWVTERRLNARGRWVVTAVDMSGRKVRVTLSARGLTDTDQRAMIEAAYKALYVPHTQRRLS